MMPFRKYSFLALLLLASCNSQAPRKNGPPPVAPVFDVPGLLGMDIDHVQAVLGGPERASEPGPGPEENTKLFRRDTTLLTVAYQANTRKVLSYFIAPASGRTRDYTALLRFANLSGAEPVLVVVPVLEPDHPGVYSGVKVFLKDGGAN